jgi:hypothetical protein
VCAVLDGALPYDVTVGGEIMTAVQTLLVWSPGLFLGMF